VNDKERAAPTSLLHAADRLNVPSFHISETVRRPCDHNSNALQVLLGDCSKLAPAYKTVLANTNCTNPSDCPGFPYPSKHTPRQCSGSSTHHIMVLNVIDMLHKSTANGAVGILNLYDFHMPKTEYISDDADDAMAVLLLYLINSSAQFSRFLVGDHGHGLSQDEGEAGGFYFASANTANDQIHKMIMTGGVMSHQTVNKMLRYGISNTDSI